MKARWWWVWVLGLIPWGVVWSQQRVATPVATEFNLVRKTETELIYGFGEALPGQRDRLGLYVRCERASGRISAGLYFGAFPAGKPVQAAVRRADGAVERFGPVVRGSPASGFHDPRLVNRENVVRLARAALSEGALISNGHNSVWNGISEAENRRVRTELFACAGL